VPLGHCQGGREKKMTKATYICRSAKKKVVTYFILFLFLFLSIFLRAVFGRFVTRGVQKHEKLFFRKSPSRLITKNAVFFSSVFFFLPWLFSSIFFSHMEDAPGVRDALLGWAGIVAE
jgi:hypothetical protein